jgi:copper(I)-binding protein
VLVVGLLAGCSGGTDPFQDLPAGGIDASTGPLIVDDIWVEGPQGLQVGANAPLRLTLTNESPTTADTLVSVSTTAAAHAVLQSNGHTVTSIALAPNSQTDLEWNTGVELQGLRQSLIPGQRIPITLTFAQSAPVTVQVAVGPLGASPSTPVPSTPPTTT